MSLSLAPSTPPSTKCQRLGPHKTKCRLTADSAYPQSHTFPVPARAGSKTHTCQESTQTRYRPIFWCISKRLSHSTLQIQWRRCIREEGRSLELSQSAVKINNKHKKLRFFWGESFITTLENSRKADGTSCLQFCYDTAWACKPMLSGPFNSIFPNPAATSSLC